MSDFSLADVELLEPQLLAAAHELMPELGTSAVEQAFHALLADCRSGTIELRTERGFRALYKQRLGWARSARATSPSRALVAIDAAGDAVDHHAETALADQEGVELGEDLDELGHDVLGQLTALEEQAWLLHVDQDLSERKIANVLAIDRHHARRLLREAGQKIAQALIVVRAGRWCAKRQAELTHARAQLTTGGEPLSEDLATRGVRHLAHCHECRLEYAHLERRLRAVARVVVPLPPLTSDRFLDHLAGTYDWLTGVRVRTHDLAAAVVQRLGGGGEGVVLGGKVAAAAAVCATAGATATVCVIAGLPFTGTAAHHHKPSPAKLAARRPAARPTVAAVTRVTPARTTRTTTTTTNTRVRNPASAKAQPGAPAPAASGPVLGPGIGPSGPSGNVPPQAAPANPDAIDLAP